MAGGLIWGGCINENFNQWDRMENILGLSGTKWTKSLKISLNNAASDWAETLLGDKW